MCYVCRIEFVTRVFPFACIQHSFGEALFTWTNGISVLSNKYMSVCNQVYDISDPDFYTYITLITLLGEQDCWHWCCSNIHSPSCELPAVPLCYRCQSWHVHCLFLVFADKHIPYFVEDIWNWSFFVSNLLPFVSNMGFVHKTKHKHHTFYVFFIHIFCMHLSLTFHWYVLK